MTAISLNLPESMAKASQEVAEELGISRNHFIRLAIGHELKKFYSLREQEAMADAFKIMESSPDYLLESQELEEGFESRLPDEKDEWWKK